MKWLAVSIWAAAPAVEMEVAGPAAGDTDNAERDSSGGVAGGGDSGLTVADILSALYEYAQVALRGLLLLLLDEAHTPRPGVDTAGAGNP